MLLLFIVAVVILVVKPFRMLFGALVMLSLQVGLVLGLWMVLFKMTGKV